MPPKTLILHLPVESPGASPIAVNPPKYTYAYPSLNNNCAPPSPLCLTSTSSGTAQSGPESGAVLGHSMEQVCTPGGSTASIIARRSSTLRKKRRIKALSVGHISPTSPMCLQSPMEAGMRSGFSNFPNLSSNYSDSDPSLDATSGGYSSVASLQLLPPPTSAAVPAPQKSSYMAKVANGLGFTKSGITEHKRDREEHSGSSSLAALGLAGILFGTRHPGQSSHEPRIQARSSSKGGARSRSKSSVGRRSRPGTSAGLINNNVDVDKPLPSRPVSRELEGEHKGAFASLFGKPGYNFHFVDHETLIPSTRSSSRNRPRSISSAAVLSGKSSTSSLNPVRLEPILPVHVLDHLVSRPEEIPPDSVSSVVQRYLTHARTDSSRTIHQRDHSGSIQTLGMNEAIDTENIRGIAAIAGRAHQESCVDVGGASVSRSNSTAQRYPRRPSRSSSSCRGIRSSSPATSEISRPGTSSSMMSTMMRQDDGRRVKPIEIDSDTEDAPRGRGRTLTLEREGLRRQYFEKEKDEEEKNMELLRGDKGLDSGKTTFPMTRKPVPAPVSRNRRPSRSSSRSRSRPRTSRASSPENTHTMSTIQESTPALPDANLKHSLASNSSLRPMLISIEKTNASRTPSPLRVIRRMQSTDSANSNLFPRARSASADAHRLPKQEPEIAEAQVPTAQLRASRILRDTTASNSSLRAKLRADAERVAQPHVPVLTEPPQNIPAACSTAGMPKRKPVPAECIAVSLTSPSPQLGAESNFPHMMVSVPPQSLNLWKRLEAPKSGCSWNGTMYSEDEEETPGTAKTFNFVTPLLPSPPKKQLGIPITHARGDESSLQKTTFSVPVSSSSSDASYSGSLPQADTIGMATAGPNICMNGTLDYNSVAVGIVESTATEENLQSQSPGSPISEPYSPINSSQPAGVSVPASSLLPIAGVPQKLESPIPVHKGVDGQSTQQSGASTASKEVIAERMRWAEERQNLQHSLDMLQAENNNLRELVSRLTVRLERQDTEFRDLPKRTKHQRLPLPEALVGSKSRNGTIVSVSHQTTDSGKNPQHGSSWNVSVNYHTSPPIPLLAKSATTRSESPTTNPHAKSKYATTHCRPGSISISSSSTLPRPVGQKENLDLLLPSNPDRSDERTLRSRGVSPSRIPRIGSSLNNSASVGNGSKLNDSTSIKNQAHQEHVPEQSQTLRKGPKALWKRTAAAATRRTKTNVGSHL